MTNNNPSSLYPTCPICTLRLFCIPRLYPVSTQLVKAILNSKDFQKNIDAKQTPPKLVKSVLVGGWNSTHLKNMIVKMGSSSPNRGEHKKRLKPPPSVWIRSLWNTLPETNIVPENRPSGREMFINFIIYQPVHCRTVELLASGRAIHRITSNIPIILLMDKILHHLGWLKPYE